MGSDTRARIQCRAFKIGVLVSVILLGVGVSLWVAALNSNQWDHRLSLGNSFHIGVCAHGLDGRLAFFSDSEYGPYQGSIIQIAGIPPLEREIRFGDRLGIYYRYLRFADEGPILWTLMISLWYPTILFVVPAIIWWIGRQKRGIKLKRERILARVEKISEIFKKPLDAEIFSCKLSIMVIVITMERLFSWTLKRNSGSSCGPGVCGKVSREMTWRMCFCVPKSM